jgi:molybdopterin synthase catalytic subunit
MQILGIVGQGATALCERVAPHFDGRVAVVEPSPAASKTDAAERADGVDAGFELGEDGTWTGSGDDRTLDGLLDDLAATYDYALVSGFPGARIPTVALGDAEARDVVRTYHDGADVDPDEVVDAAEEREPRVTLQTLIERIKASPRADRAGAIATFTGRVRARDAEDDPRTVQLTFEKYEGVAEERMATIESELADREGVQEVLMHHRTGVIEDGEDIVFVVVLAGHREEAFRTVEDGINRLKDEVPIFKKETTVESDFWVHDRE